MTLNRHLIYKAYQNIKACPESFDMKIWGRSGTCGTVACFAGHVTFIDKSGYYYENDLCNTIDSNGEPVFDSELVFKTLGLLENNLFYWHYWPKYLLKIYDTNPTKALRQAIVHFTQYDPEFSPEQGDGLLMEEVVLSASLEIQEVEA